jgi:hypothetical protein
MNAKPLLPESAAVRRVNLETERQHPEGAIVATDDPQLIREWARQHSAEPATGEATDSGPATINVQDGGSAIRFNFPAAAPFRPITWDEWFDNFRRHDLLFVYERDCHDAAPDSRYRTVPKGRVRELQND